MGRIEQVLDVLGQAATTAITNAGIVSPAQNYIGSPVPTELTEILNQGGYAVSLFPLPGGRRLAPRGKDQTEVTVAAPTVNASISHGINTEITFTGTPGVYNFNVVYGHPVLGTQFVYYQSLSTDTLNSIAAAIVVLFSGVPGPVTVSASGPVITIHGASSVRCNVGSTGSYTQFQSRFEQRIQLSVWAPTAYQNTGNPTVDAPLNIRAAVCEAIVNNVGTDMNQWYALADGSAVRLRLTTMPVYRDDSQVDYNLYEAHLIYLAEYVLQTTVSATQVGVIEESTSIGGSAPVTTFGG